MRDPAVTGEQTLRERMTSWEQGEANAVEAALPPYLESFLGHLRLLVGLPFRYLVPDARLLPDESLRFFHLDRSWTDRLVDGALAVGKFGTREQAHHHARHAQVSGELDRTEHAVRDLQRGEAGLDEAKEAAAKAGRDDATPVSGFLLRSALVGGWPHMEVRAFADAAGSKPLPTLRLERLGGAVMIGLFAGVPRLVTFEEPHHGVQLGVDERPDGTLRVRRRSATGTIVQGSAPVDVPVRRVNPRVVAVAGLAGTLGASGGAAMALALLRPPWRQRFSNDEGGGQPAAFEPGHLVAEETRRLGPADIRRLMARELRSGDAPR